SVNARTGQVGTLVGQDAWTFGKLDGAREQALLQQPQAIALDPDTPQLWILDSGNDSLRALRLGGGELRTVTLSQRLHGAAGLVVADGMAWISDTDAHAVLCVDLKSGTVQHVPVGE